MARPALKILVSVINWNNATATEKCLASIAAIPKNEQPDIVVTDNGSDAAFMISSKLKQDLSSVRVVTNKQNLGFAGGHNPIIKMSVNQGYDYVVLLNNDSQVIDKDIFKELSAAIENEPSAIGANPTILSSLEPSVIWYGGGRLSLKSGHASHSMVGLGYSLVPDKPRKVSLLTGGCLAINLRRVPLDELLLSEDYFVYWEDTDWCAKAIRSGHVLLYVPKVRLLHLVSSSLGTQSPSYIYYNIRNHLIFIRRNLPGIYKLLGGLNVMYICFKYSLNILIRYRSKRRRCFKAIVTGLLDGSGGHTGQLRRTL